MGQRYDEMIEREFESHENVTQAHNRRVQPYLRTGPNKKWDIRFLEMAKHISTWSKDPSTQVGSVIVRPDRTISSIGYNGLPKGMRDTESRLYDREDKYDRTVHAEMNAILSSHEKLKDHTIYIWPFLACQRCAVHIIQSGIIRVVAPSCPEDKLERYDSHFRKSREYLRECGVLVDEVPLGMFTPIADMI